MVNYARPLSVFYTKGRDETRYNSYRVADKTSLTFGADLFNALNHPNLANPISFIGSGLFGISTASVANSEVGRGRLA